jgi:hypothetical protein
VRAGPDRPVALVPKPDRVVRSVFGRNPRGIRVSCWRFAGGMWLRCGGRFRDHEPVQNRVAWCGNPGPFWAESTVVLMWNPGFVLAEPSGVVAVWRNQAVPVEAGVSASLAFPY